MKLEHIRRWGILGIVTVFLFGCQSVEDGPSGFTSTSEKQPIVSQEKADETKKEVEKIDEIDHVRAISFNDEIYLSLSVSGFNRLFLKQIRKDAHNRAKKNNQEATIHISTDKKVDMELLDIEEKMKKGMSKTELEKELKKVEEDMRG